MHQQRFTKPGKLAGSYKPGIKNYFGSMLKPSLSLIIPFCSGSVSYRVIVTTSEMAIALVSVAAITE